MVQGARARARIKKKQASNIQWQDEFKSIHYKNGIPSSPPQVQQAL